jgi:hypothetical protein
MSKEDSDSVLRGVWSLGECGRYRRLGPRLFPQVEGRGAG